jgi:hypothetical protein
VVVTMIGKVGEWEDVEVVLDDVVVMLRSVDVLLSNVPFSLYFLGWRRSKPDHEPTHDFCDCCGACRSTGND